MSRYSNDLRKKVVDYYHSCQDKDQTIRTFNLARQTVYDWIDLDKQGKLYETKDLIFLEIN